MNIQDSWEKALRQTEVIRPRVQPLNTFSPTRIPYVMLSESVVNTGDTVVRKGQIVVERPAIVLPYNLPQFEGFEFDDDRHFNEDMLTNFFLVRGVSLPSLRYNNKTSSMEVFEGGLSKAIAHHSAIIHRSEDVHTGLIVGPEDSWQFSLLIFVSGQIARNVDGDVRKLLDGYRKNGGLN